MKILLKEVKSLFSVWALVGALSVLFLLNYIYFYYISESVAVSILISIFTAIFIFLTVTVRNKKLKKHQFNLSELMKYTTNMTFHLKNGKNILEALEASKVSVSYHIQKDIQRTIDDLERNSDLNTDHFKAYKFPALNQFHNALQILYKKGGNIQEIFNPVNDSILFEITKRDELYQQKKGVAFQIYSMTLMVVGIPAIFKTASSQLWDQFIASSLSLIILSVIHILILIHLNAVEKKKVDISIQV